MVSECVVQFCWPPLQACGQSACEQYQRPVHHFLILLGSKWPAAPLPTSRATNSQKSPASTPQTVLEAPPPAPQAWAWPLNSDHSFVIPDITKKVAECSDGTRVMADDDGDPEHMAMGQKSPQQFRFVVPT